MSNSPRRRQVDPRTPRNRWPGSRLPGCPHHGWHVLAGPPSRSRHPGGAQTRRACQVEQCVRATVHHKPIRSKRPNLNGFRRKTTGRDRREPGRPQRTEWGTTPHRQAERGRQWVCTAVRQDVPDRPAPARRAGRRPDSAGGHAMAICGAIATCRVMATRGAIATWGATAGSTCGSTGGVRGDGTEDAVLVGVLAGGD